MLKGVNNYEIGTIIVKDMSRLGRNYIEVGNLTEMVFPLYEVRFIAINDGVDSIDGEDDFAPFRNVINEWYPKDISRKIRSAWRMKNEQKLPLGPPPFGYRPDPEDHKLWIVEREAAETVQYIYKLRRKRYSVTAIADILEKEKYLTPTAYALHNGYKTCAKPSPRGDYAWRSNIIYNILKNQAHVGDVINFKTYSKSYKLKKRLPKPKDEWVIHKDVFESIIDRDYWEAVQRTFNQTRVRDSNYTDKNFFTGYLKCSECGANLNYKYTHDNPNSHFYSCHSKRQKLGICHSNHHIRVEDLIQLVTSHINSILAYTDAYKDEFVKLLSDHHYSELHESQKKNRTRQDTLQQREKELDILFEKTYEDHAFGKLSEDRYFKMTAKYDAEYKTIKGEIKEVKSILEKQESTKLKTEAFIEIVDRYTYIDEVTPEILDAFIDKIVVHEKDKSSSTVRQKVEIFYKIVGHIDLPVSADYNTVETSKSHFRIDSKVTSF